MIFLKSPNNFGTAGRNSAAHVIALPYDKCMLKLGGMTGQL